ncbi:MAG: glycosyltransferase family 39 protein [Candidatus Goldbacteria bacterium]|nr:glycosyltransferase family 39 protein [Candidatus Goldiibacteriota bacterium]
MKVKKKVKQSIVLSTTTILIAIIILFAFLLFFSYGIIPESRFSYLQYQFFNNINLPLKNISLLNHKLLFPPYFIYYLIVISLICVVLFKFFSKSAIKTCLSHHLKSGAGDVIHRSSLKQLNNKMIFIFIFIFIFFIHGVFINLFLKEKFFLLQFFLFITEMTIFLFIAAILDKKNKINYFDIKHLTGDEIKTLLLFFMLCLVLYTFDLKSWKYSYIEDEWPFFDFIKGNLSEIYKINFFSGSGVYGYHPVSSSVWQAIIMFFTDKGIFGWKLSSAIIIPLSIIPFYLWNKMIFNRSVAIIATVVFVFSNAMLGFAHLGYNNIQSIFLYVGVLCSLELAIQKKSHFWFFVSSLFAGLGFYTFYTARIIILIAVLYFFLHPLKKQIRKSQIMFSLLVFLLIISPTILEKNFINKMLNQSLIAGSEIKNPSERYIYIILNFIHSFFAFLYKYKNTHYIIDGLVDIFSAIGVITGLIWIICSFLKDWRAKFLSITYIILVFFIGGLQQYDYPVNTRLYFLVPSLATIAGVGLSRLAILSIYFNKSKKFHYFILFIFCTIIILNNLYTFYIKMPQKFYFFKQAYIMKTIQKYKGIQKILVIDGISNFRRMIEFYEPKNKIIYSDLYNFEKLLKDDFVKNSIVIFDDLAADRITEIEKQIKPEYIIDNLRKKISLYIFDFTDDERYKKFYELWKGEY